MMPTKEELARWKSKAVTGSWEHRTILTLIKALEGEGESKGEPQDWDKKAPAKLFGK